MLLGGLFVILLGPLMVRGGRIEISDTTAGQKIAFLNSTMPKFVASAKFNSSTPKPIIKLLASVNYGGTATAAGPICTKAMELALDRLKMNENWLPNYELVFELIDDKCDDGPAVNGLTRTLEQVPNGNQPGSRIPMMITSQCPGTGATMTSAIIKYYDYIGFSVAQKSTDLELDRSKFSSYFGLGPFTGMTAIALVELFHLVGWKKMAIISEMLPFYNDGERYIIPLLERSNITLQWFGKVTAQSTNSEEMDKTFAEMKSRNPRLIYQRTNSAISLSCWLHRFGMFGPNYIIFSGDWSFFNPNTAKIPDYVASWCTRAMLAEVLPSWFFFGGGTLRDAYNPEFSDSTGLTGNMFLRSLKEKVVEAEKSPTWFTWPQLCYDSALYAGYLANATEAVLRQSNQTLLNWTTETSNFKENGKTMVDIMKKALYSVKVEGMRGQYQFDSTTTVNSLGYTPIAFYRARKLKSGPGTQYESALVAYYKSNTKANNGMVILNGKLKWDTVDGQPTRDSIQIIRTQLPPTDVSSYAVLSAFGIGEIVFAFLLIAISLIKRKYPDFVQFRLLAEFSTAEYLMLFGNAVMSSHVLAQPLSTSKHINVNCTVEGFLILLGFAASTLSMLLKLAKAVPSRQRTTSRPKLKKGHSIFLNVVVTTLAKQTAGTIFSWTALHGALLAGFFIAAPIQLAEVIFPAEVSKEDISVFYEPFVLECRLNSKVNSNEVALCLLVCMALLHGFVVLRTCLRAYDIQARFKKIVLAPGTKSTCICVYCSIGVLVAGFLACLLEADDIQDIQTALSSTIICYALVNDAFLCYGKLSTKTQSDAESQRPKLDTEAFSKSKVGSIPEKRTTSLTRDY